MNRQRLRVGLIIAHIIREAVNGGDLQKPATLSLISKQTRNLLARLRIIASDRLRFSRSVRYLHSCAIEQRERLRRPKDSNGIARSLANLAAAGRSGFDLRNLSPLEAKVRDLMRHWTPANFSWDEFFPNTESDLVRRSIILKKPQSREEKGVLFVAFETQWIRLFRHADIESLARDYEIILSPTWSPSYDLALFITARMWPTHLFSILSNLDDLPVFARISTSLHPIRLLASNWVNPELAISDGEPEKKYDIVVIANWAKYKRHFALFQALAEMDSNLKVLLLGVPWGGRSRQSIEVEADLFGVRNQLVIKEAVPHSEVFRELRSGKICVILSMLEGSCCGRGGSFRRRASRITKGREDLFEHVHQSPHWSTP